MNHCRWCGAELVQGRVAGYDPFDGDPIHLYVCPNDRWWKLFAFHSVMFQGRFIR